MTNDKNRRPCRRTALGRASSVTRGGPDGYIEVTGFLPRNGISRS
jgi:hypothetical protein